MQAVAPVRRLGGAEMPSLWSLCPFRVWPEGGTGVPKVLLFSLLGGGAAARRVASGALPLDATYLPIYPSGARLAH